MNVHFNEAVQIHVLVKWKFAYQAARRGHWEQHARDRERFRFKIKNYYSIIINPVLENMIKKCI